MWKYSISSYHQGEYSFTYNNLTIVGKAIRDPYSKKTIIIGTDGKVGIYSDKKGLSIRRKKKNK